MFYLLNENSEQYRLIIRMMLGACLYYLKYILTGDYFTNLEERSISIVGHDHLLAQRLNANVNFLRRCFEQSLLFGVTIHELLTQCNINDFNFYDQLNGNVTLAFLDVVPKHNTAELFYISVFSIFEITLYYAEGGITIQSYKIRVQEPPVVLTEPESDVLTFLTTQAMAVNCIATPWTLILNILYTIFVTENCVARIVVGKLGNDPKNLEKYFSILNTHLTQLQEQYNAAITEENRDILTVILQAITTTGQLQSNIIAQSRLCQLPENPLDSIYTRRDQPPLQYVPLNVRYDTLKNSCKAWVQQMFILAVNPQKRELFFLSAAYPFTTRSYTRLERGICYAWSVNANICNRDDFIRGFSPSTIFPSAIPPGVNANYPDGVDANFQPVYNMGSPNERRMHETVTGLQQIISRAIATSNGFAVTPNPAYLDRDIPRTWLHYQYMNHLWKHLTDTSIKLRSMFKSNVKDLKRIVGSKNFTANSLAGAYPVLLLIQELLESNNTDDRNALERETNRVETLNCRRGLLPLLVPAEPNDTLFARMVVELLYDDYTNSGNDPKIYSTNYILIFLGFLFSIKIKSSASIGPRNMLSLVDSIINFGNMSAESRREITQLLNYTGTDDSPVAPGECSLATLSSNLDTEACATGGVVVHRGGAPKPAASSAAKKVDAAAAPKPAAPKPAPPKKVDAADKASAAVKGFAVPVKASATVKAAKSVAVAIKVSEAPIKIISAPGKASDANAAGVSKPHAKEKPPSKEKLSKLQQKAEKAAAAAAVAPILLKNKLLYPLLNPESGPFKKFMDKIKEVLRSPIGGRPALLPLYEPNTCVSGTTRQAVYDINTFYNRNGTVYSNDVYGPLRVSVGGSNKKTKTNNKLSKPNNHTRRNKNKRKKNSKTKTKTKAKSSPKYKKRIPYSRSGSQSNRKKSKPKKSQKNVTFKRRRARK
jgi:hypothetical protein